jgi:UMF1 family MFS transporter
VTAPPAADREHRRRTRAWILYDWANSAFATTVMAAVFPPFFRSIAEADGLSASAATSRWGLITGGALLVIAVSSPVLGALADAAGGKKRLLTGFWLLGVLATASFALLPDDRWPLAAAAFVIANLGFAGSIVFYESLLPHVAQPGEMDDLSSRGYAWGYLGGGILLVINALWITMPERLGFGSAGTAIRASFLSVAVWWLVFAIPLLRRVPEPRAVATVAPGRLWQESFGRLGRTWRHLRQYRPLLVMLVAYWLYNDGIGTIVKMATAYGGELGIGTADMIQALVLTQFVGLPATLLMGRFAGRWGARPVLLGGLGVYTLICVLGFFLHTTWQFYALAALVGTVQGGCQALSRSLFGSMVPRHKSAEFFGFYATSSKFAGIAGPLIFALVGALLGSSRLSILALILFFVGGGLLLLRVDLDAGRAQARAAERAAGQVGAAADDPQG